MIRFVWILFAVLLCVEAEAKKSKASSAVRGEFVDVNVLGSPKEEFTLKFAKFPGGKPPKVDVRGRHVSFVFDAPGRLALAAFKKKLPCYVKVMSISEEGASFALRLRTVKPYALISASNDGTSFTFAPSAVQSGTICAPDQEEEDAPQKEKKGDKSSEKEKKAEGKTQEKLLSKKEKETASQESSSTASPEIKKGVNPNVMQQVTFTWDEAQKQLSFKSYEDIGIASFWRDKSYRIVFDRQIFWDEKFWSGLKKSSFFKNVTYGNTSNGAWVLFEFENALFDGVAKENKTWMITFSKKEIPLEERITFSIQKNAEGKPYFSLGILGAKRIITIDDPLYLETYLVIPSTVLGYAFTKFMDFVPLNLFQTTMGLVVQQKEDSLEVSLDRDVVLIKHPNGLFISTKKGKMVTASQVLTSLLKLKDWSSDPRMWVDIQRELRRAVSQTHGVEKFRAHMDLARFYLSSSMEAEALSVLEYMERDNSALALHKEFLALRAVAYILMRDYEKAKKVIEMGQLINNPEINTWQGFIDAGEGKWDEAFPRLKQVSFFAKSYPPEVANALLLQTAEVTLNKGYIEEATHLLKRLHDETLSTAQITLKQYIEAMIAFHSGNRDEALKLMQPLYEGRNKLVRTKAGLFLIGEKMKSGEMKPQEAVDRLENMRYDWRGGYLEYEVMIKLAEAYALIKDVKKVLQTYSDVVKAFPKNKAYKEASEQKIGTYLEEALTAPPDNTRNRITLVALFREYYPLIKKHAKNYRKTLESVLGDYVALNLFDTADSVIDELIDLAPGVPEKDALLFKKSALYLLDEKTEKAHQALQSIKGTDNETQKKKRLFLAEEALIAKKTTEALDVIKNDMEYEAEKLRAYIYQREKNWIMAGRSYEKLITSKDTPIAMDIDYLLYSVLSYALANDDESMSRLRAAYQKQMDTSIHKEIFSALTDKASTTYEQKLMQFAKVFEKSGAALHVSLRKLIEA